MHVGLNDFSWLEGFILAAQEHVVADASALGSSSITSKLNAFEPATRADFDLDLKFSKVEVGNKALGGTCGGHGL